MNTQVKQKSKFNVRTLTVLAILSAMAYLLVVVINIPIVPGVEFLKYEPKDVVITIGSFLFGPWASVLMSLVVSFVEMLTISASGPIGFLMNVLSTVGFCTTAGLIYKKKRTLSGAVIGLIAGALVMCLLMLGWNYIVTPFYQGVPREAVAQMLLPIFLPYNLFKSVLNGALSMLLYKPVVTALRRTGFVSSSREEGAKKGEVKSMKNTLGTIIISVFVILTVVLILLAMNGLL